MKTFRLIGIAIMAILISVNFASCSSDDDEEPIKNDDGVITNQKQLMQIKMVDSGTITWDFTYDSKGRLISINHAEKYDDGETYRDITNFTWNNGEFYQFNLSSCIRQQNSLTAQFVSFSLSNLANIFYPPQFLQ